MTGSTFHLNLMGKPVGFPARFRVTGRTKIYRVAEAGMIRIGGRLVSGQMTVCILTADGCTHIHLLQMTELTFNTPMFSGQDKSRLLHAMGKFGSLPVFRAVAKFTFNSDIAIAMGRFGRLRMLNAMTAFTGKVLKCFMLKSFFIPTVLGMTVFTDRNDVVGLMIKFCIQECCRRQSRWNMTGIAGQREIIIPGTMTLGTFSPGVGSPQGELGTIMLETGPGPGHSRVTQRAVLLINPIPVGWCQGKFTTTGLLIFIAVARPTVLRCTRGLTLMTARAIGNNMRPTEGPFSIAVMIEISIGPAQASERVAPITSVTQSNRSVIRFIRVLEVLTVAGPAVHGRVADLPQVRMALFAGYRGMDTGE